MSKDLPKYKYIKISLEKIDKYIFLYSDYESLEKLDQLFELIDIVDNCSIYGVKAESGEDKNKYKEELFEYDKDASGVFEKLRLFETKTYNCTWNFNSAVTVQNEKELDYKRTNENQFSFRVVNYLGKSALLIEGNKKIPFEIVPTKIDYENDYVTLTKDIADQCSQLLLDYTSPTNLNFKFNSDRSQRTPLEQFIFIRKFCSSKNIEYLMQCIKMNPDRMLVTEDELKPFGTASISKKFFSNPFSNSKNWCKQTNGYYFPELITTTRKYDSYNTSANQFIKFAFRTFIQICQNVLNYTNDKKHTYYDEAKYLKDFLEVILLDSFFDDVQDLSSMPINNQVLQKREGYSQIFNAFNMLDLAMQLDWEGQKDVYEGEARNIALLYEYWLVFKFVQIFRELGAEIKFDLKDENDAKEFLSKENGLLISLKQGKQSYIPMLLEDRKVKINFYYNRTFSQKEFDGTNYEGSYSRFFRPDYTLAIFPDDIDDENEAIKKGLVSFVHFDAKYRVSDITSLFGKDVKDIIQEKKEQSEDEKKFLENGLSESEKEKIEEEVVGVYLSYQKKEETINTYNRGDLLKMHTYNDAIRRTVGSYVLYPGKEDNDKERFNVYDELLPGVGAFAIRPGDKEQKGEEAITQFINDIIDFKTKESSRQYRKEYFENIILNTASDKELNIQEDSEVSLDSELTMIGYIKEDYYEYLQNSQQLLSEDGFYYYFPVIKKGKVYSIHKETCKAQYLRLVKWNNYKAENFSDNKYDILEPCNFEIISIELVPESTIRSLLTDFRPKQPFNAEYYYLVKAKYKNPSPLVGTNTDENETISPYAPKIVCLKGM